MGDIAEMMLDGTLCQECGGLMEDLFDGNKVELNDPPGYPRNCPNCEDELKKIDDEILKILKMRREMSRLQEELRSADHDGQQTEALQIFQKMHRLTMEMAELSQRRKKDRRYY